MLSIEPEVFIDGRGARSKCSGTTLVLFVWLASWSLGSFQVQGTVAYRAAVASAGVALAGAAVAGAGRHGDVGLGWYRNRSR
ncbi:hypothetical protein BJX68DRAFT_227082 [Aspergillus pseudodeflectus]|uniref:Uncharacterized protein n=1 Tax=Aspergillus pseudodeflectus TaxID=176178 RepID=A0ABR4L2G4_9EURO